MNRNTIVTVVIAVLAMVAGWQFLHAGNLQSDLDALQTSHNKLVKEHQEQIDLLNKNIARLERELRNAQSQSNLASAEKLGTETPANTAANAQAQGGALGNFIRQRLASPEGQTVMVQMAYSQRYGAFISTLKLPANVESALKQKIMDVLNRTVSVQLKVASGQASRDELKSLNPDREINAVMAEYLNRQQLDAFQAYDANRVAQAGNQVRTTVSRQLATEVPGLTEQNRTLLANAITAALTNAGATNAAGQAAQAMNMGTILEQVEYSLPATMEEDQLKLARDYLRQRAKLLNVLTQ